jgi:D-glycero-D-manno-heptose 1,7-bisphosphate phosphatase
MVMLDRDGVINQDDPGYIKSVEEWHPLPGSISAIVDMQRMGIKVAVCTNQSGIARHLIAVADLEEIHQAMNQALIDAGGSAIPVFFCPHHPDDDCQCRKPRPGMLFAALTQAGLTPEDAWFVGDSLRDLQAAEAAGCHPVLLRTGKEINTERSFETSGILTIAPSLDYLVGRISS